jgi:putative polymerase
MFLNLMIGSTAIFSMKTAGLVWLLVGYLKFNEGKLAATAASPVAEPATVDNGGVLDPGYQPAMAADIRPA